MKTQQDQELSQDNIMRLHLYQAKQTLEQRQRARLANRVDSYCKQLGLGIPLSLKPVNFALIQLAAGVNEELAYELGASTARIMVLIGSKPGETIISCKPRTLH